MAEEVTLKVNVQTGEAVNNLGKLEKATKDVTSTVDKTGKGTQNGVVRRCPAPVRSLREIV